MDVWLRHLICLLLLALWGLLSIPGVNGQAKVKPVTTHLSAKWSHTPLLLEATEFMAEENGPTFWGYVEAIAEEDHKIFTDGTDGEKFEAAISTASNFLLLSQLPLLKLSLSLRSYSPKIEMFHQIALDRDLPSDCGAVVDVNGEVTCDVGRVRELVEAATKGGSSKPVMYEVDHHYPGGENAKVGVVLYAEVGSSELPTFHEPLKQLAISGTIDYVLRHRIKKRGGRKVRLSGFGVELAIKSTEYKAQDDTKVQEEASGQQQEEDQEVEVEGFLFSKLEALHPDKRDDLEQLRKHMEESRHEMAPMKVWQLQHLSMQAAQRIMSAPLDQQLSLLVHTAQNFPVLARSLVRIKVDDKMKREILKNQNQLSSQMELNPSDGGLFINGIYLDMEYTNIYQLLEQIRSEDRVMSGLHKFGLQGESLKSLLYLDVIDNTQDYGIDIRDSAIMWMNNIESDRAYRKWPSSVGELLRPTYPGMLRSIRKNFHNLVLVADPSKSTTGDLLKLLESFVTHNAPTRIGLVMAVSPEETLRGYDDPSMAILCAFNYVSENLAGREDANYKALQFLIEIYTSTQGDLRVTDVTTAFKNKYPSTDLDDVFGEDSDYDVGRLLSQEFIEKAGITSLPQALFNGVPVPQKHLNAEEFEEVVLMEVMKMTQTLQRAVYKAELDDKHDVVDWLMALPNIMPRLNEKILGTKTSQYIDLTATSTETLSAFTPTRFATLKPSDMTGVMLKSCRYLTAKNEPNIRPLTVWVVGDYDTENGMSLLLEAVKYLRESNSVRLCAIHNKESTAKPGLITRIIEVSQASLPPALARQFLSKILAPENARKIIEGAKKWSDFAVTGMDTEAFGSRLTAFKAEIIELQSVYARKVLSLAPQARTVIANGRMLGVLKPTEKFAQEDYGLLEKYFQSTLGEKIVEILEGEDELPFDISTTIMKVSGVLQTKAQTKARASISLRSDQYSVIKLPPRHPDRPAFDIVAIFDPVSQAAQKIGPLLLVLQETLNANIRVVLNAREKHSEMPLKSFYRYVVEPEPQFSDGELTAGPHARFTGLPETSILTLNYHAPENWLVEVVQSVHDLDNIKLESVESGVHSEFELEHLLLEGHCFEQSSGNPPRGLQFTLGTRQQPVMVDTIVMANLGYFQLKANPGAWLLKLRHGRSADIYTIANHEGTDTPAGSEDVEILISSFGSHVVKVRVAKQPGKQHQSLLTDDNEDAQGGGLWSSITSTFSSGGDGDSEDEEEQINIFSVASGHLYERFLRIMMVSVLRHTKTPVKFWFLKNFLSPSFKDLLPLLAKEYGFEYELVQYKWPRWLHQQTEKQRIIWGYKILFLDVLFPLDIKKIIFVDADQVVRDDIKTLKNEDLDGAPYGFVPFCDSRKEIEGFRFWKQGYWRNHLAGRKYHISALFVVDLKRFRRIAAGDRLRGQYQGLSQDPNSLSNLDQDLPNNMVHQVRIKSLPQDWLWCESWCDDESKSTAKIIDLCNNPMTKEAKLDAAQRIIPEWIDYDNERSEPLCNNPMTKEAKLDAAQRIIPEWIDYDNEIKSTINKIKQNKSSQSQGSGNVGGGHTEL